MAVVGVATLRKRQKTKKWAFGGVFFEFNFGHVAKVGVATFRKRQNKLNFWGLLGGDSVKLTRQR